MDKDITFSMILKKKLFLDIVFQKLEQFELIRFLVRFTFSKRINDIQGKSITKNIWYFL
jgi:hypothetical protein